MLYDNDTLLDQALLWFVNKVIQLSCYKNPYHLTFRYCLNKHFHNIFNFNNKLTCRY